MTWTIGQWRLYVAAVPTNWNPLLGGWMWNLRQTEGGWERYGQVDSREIAFTNALDCAQRMERDGYGETYSVMFEGQQYLVVLSPFADVGTLVAQIVHKATGAEAIDLNALALFSNGIAVNMHAQAGMLWGESNELKRVANATR